MEIVIDISEELKNNIDACGLFLNPKDKTDLIKAIQNGTPLTECEAEDTVSLETYKQVTGERDVAIEQLHELGYELGQKIDKAEDCISRKAVLDMAETIQTDDYSGNEILDVVFVEDIKDLPSVYPKSYKENENESTDGIS